MPDVPPRAESELRAELDAFAATKEPLGSHEAFEFLDSFVSRAREQTRRLEVDGVAGPKTVEPYKLIIDAYRTAAERTTGTTPGICSELAEFWTLALERNELMGTDDLPNARHSSASRFQRQRSIDPRQSLNPRKKAQFDFTSANPPRRGGRPPLSFRRDAGWKSAARQPSNRKKPKGSGDDNG